MKSLLQKIYLLIYPWSYSADGNTRVHRVTGKKEVAVMGEDWLCAPVVDSWIDA